MRVVYFANVREALGREAQILEIGAAATIADLLDNMAAADPLCAAAFARRGKLRFALDQKMAKADASLAGAKELAIFPPVTGG